MFILPLILVVRLGCQHGVAFYNFERRLIDGQRPQAGEVFALDHFVVPPSPSHFHFFVFLLVSSLLLAFPFFSFLFISLCHCRAILRRSSAAIAMATSFRLVCYSSLFSAPLLISPSHLISFSFASSDSRSNTVEVLFKEGPSAVTKIKILRDQTTFLASCLNGGVIESSFKLSPFLFLIYDGFGVDLFI